MKLSNKERADRLIQRIAEQVVRGTGKGLNAGRIFLTARVKETLNVPAPKVALRGIPGAGKKLGPVVGYRATTPATAGAAPRKLSARLQTSVSSKMLTDKIAVIGANARAQPTKKYPQGFNYPKYHEIKDPRFKRSGRHQFIVPTLKKWFRQVAVIVGRPVVSAISTRK